MDDKHYAKINNFISNNIDLISEYESIEGVLPIEYSKGDITKMYSTLAKINKCVEYNTVMTDAFKTAIKNRVDVTDVLEALIAEASTESSSINITQSYFKEINKIYNKNKNRYDIEYTEDNRDKLIEMNLKTVVMIAKKYQGLGLTLNELISAGNLGLVIAWDKFDPSRSKLKDDILNSIESLPDTFNYQELFRVVEPYLKYGDIKKKFSEQFIAGKTYTKYELVKWIDANIFNAKFNSIAVMWIRAYILIEIDNNSRIVKKPKAVIYKDKELEGAYKKEVTVDIDAPISDDSDTSVGSVMNLADDTYTDMEISEAYNTFKSGLALLLDGVKPRDRSIFLKKFGIGLPRPMQPKEIADQEGLSIARVSQIFQTVIEQMQRNQIKYNINEQVLFDAVKKIL